MFRVEYTNSFSDVIHEWYKRLDSRLARQLKFLEWNQQIFK